MAKSLLFIEMSRAWSAGADGGSLDDFAPWLRAELEDIFRGEDVEIAVQVTPEIRFNRIAFGGRFPRAFVFDRLPGLIEALQRRWHRTERVTA